MMNPHAALDEKKRKRPTYHKTPSSPRVDLYEYVQRFLSLAAQLMPCFFLSFAEIVGMPSCFPIAYLTALAVCGQRYSFPLFGLALAFLCRLLWNMPAHWQILTALPLLLPFAGAMRERHNISVLLFVFSLLLPGFAVTAATGTVKDSLLYAGAVLLSMFSAPIMVRALKACNDKRLRACLDARIALIFLGCLVLSGCARLAAGPVNLGITAATAITCMLSIEAGLPAGLCCGMISGLVLALQGLPITLCIALSIGGFLAGTAREMGKRLLACAAFALGASLFLLLCGTWSPLIPTLAGTLLAALCPKTLYERLHSFLKSLYHSAYARFDTYAADALSQWKKTIAEMAHTVPEPGEMQPEHNGRWWQQHLCCACPDINACDVMRTEAGIRRAEEVWGNNSADDASWQEALENLRGLGCGRLYCLRSSMDQLRRDSIAQRKQCTQARYQHDMLVTHLTALSAAAGKYAAISYRHSWWEEMYTRRVRSIMSENAIPAALLYLTKVDDHVLAAFEVYSIGEVMKLRDELTALLSSVLQLRMYVSSIEGDRIYLREMTIFSVRVGQKLLCAENHEATGDSVYAGMLQNGSFAAILSDGMGQGRHAGEESSATIRLLQLCLEAGYSREQAITAVNGMMLLETGGERFATADLLTIDLWSGHAHLDKLGAAGSWLLRGSTLVQLTGDALPVGIMETVESRSSLLRLKSGDNLLLMTDGVEDAFPTPEALEHAVRRSLEQPDPATGAEYLIQQATRIQKERSHDDMTAVVLHICKNPGP